MEDSIGGTESQEDSTVADSLSQGRSDLQVGDINESVHTNGLDVEPSRGTKPGTGEGGSRGNNSAASGEDKEKKKKKKIKGEGNEEEEGGDDNTSKGKDKSKRMNKKETNPDKTRELLCIRICSVQVLRLIPAHRFKKNQPWVRVNYGKSPDHEWIAPYEESEIGERADFLDLTWEFILQRDTRHREDLTVTVLSEDLIIGRYVLGAADFQEIPVTKSGYFKVTGNVLNALGVAGECRIVFKKVIAEPPKAPRFLEARPDTILTNALPHTARSYIRFISIAVADLKSVHGMFEYNSPHVAMECGKWNKTTDTRVGAGLAAKWNRLPWKLVMDKFHDLVVKVNSKDDLIGNVSFTLDELRDFEANDQGFIEIIRPLTDGANMTGRIRLYIMVKDMDPSDDADTYQLLVPSAGYEHEMLRGDNFHFTSDEIQARQVRAGVKPSGRIAGGTDQGPGGEEEKDYQQGAKDAKKDIYKQFGNGMLGADSPSKRGGAVHPKNKGLLHARNIIIGSIEFVPFVMKVSEAGVFDSRQAHPIKPNSLSLNAACGGWGGCTVQVKNSGPDAYWVGLAETWRFVVEEGSKLHLNVWSRDSFIGSCALTTDQIKQYPIDPDGQTEMLLVISDEGKSTGRLRINASFEYLREGENTNYDPQPEPVQYKPAGAKKLKMDKYGEVPTYDLPCIAKVMSITAVDLKPAHTLFPNSPRCRVVCERKQALTPVAKYGGSMARWTELDWEIPINEGAIMMVYLYSGKSQIGFLELPAHHITDEPLDKYGYTQINHLIRNHDGSSTGKVSIYLQLEALPDIQVYDQVQENGAWRNPYDLNPPPLVPTQQVVLDPILQKMAERPFFTLADAMEAGQGVMMQVVIKELDVTDLDPVHWFGKKNSPVVSGACGRWAETTTVSPDAGESAYWVGLEWKFLMDDKLHVQFVVGSEEKVIGSVKCGAKEFCVAKMDQRGVKRMSVNMLSKRHHFAGKLKITYTLGVVRENQYIDRPKAVDRLDDEDIAAPFNAIVKKITVTGMPRVHTVGPNEPRFRISHDVWSQMTPVSTSGLSEEAMWTDSDLAQQGADVWVVPIHDDSQSVIFSVISGSELIGICEVNPLDLANIPRKLGGVAEVAGTLKKDGRETGRVLVVAVLRNLSTKYVPDEDEAAAAEAEAQAAARQQERQKQWASKQQFQGEETLKAQQEQFSYKIKSFHEKEEARRKEAEKQKAMDEFKRVKLQAELELARDREMKVQHQVLVREHAMHKYAPMGDNPANMHSYQSNNSLPQLQYAAGGLNTGRDTVQTSQFSVLGDNDSLAGGLLMQGMHESHMPPTKFPTNIQFASQPMTSGQAALLANINPEIDRRDDKSETAATLPPITSNTSAKGSAGAARPPSSQPPAAAQRLLTTESAPADTLQDYEDAGSVVGGASVATGMTGSTKFTAKPPSGPRPDHAQSMVPGADQPSGKTEVIHTDILQRSSSVGLGVSEKTLKMKTYDKDTGLVSNKFDDHNEARTKIVSTPATFGMTVHGVAVLNARSVHVMSKNSMRVQLECDNYSFASDELPKCGDAGQWSSLNWKIGRVRGTAPDCEVKLTVHSGSSVVGTLAFSPDALYQKSLLERPGAVVKHFDEMKEGAVFCGKVRLNYSVQTK